MTDRLTRTIKAISVKNKAEGEIGFLTNEEDQHWYNIKADEKILDGVLEKLIKKGNKVEFELKNGYAENFKMLEEAKSSKWEDEIVSFETLLTKAHGLKNHFSIKTKMLELDVEKKFALFKARVIVSNGEIIDNERAFNVFEGHGDATDSNVKGENIKPHFIRMAETRAIVRALRWYTNNGCAEEEK